MQTKFSYRVLKWTFLAGVACSMATACVVSSGDGNDDDTNIGEGGDGGSSTPTGGKATGGGGSSSAGTNSASGATSEGGEPSMGTGGTPSGFVPGACQEGDDALTPTSEPSCDAAAGDSACIECIKLQACSAFQTCFGTEPATACSVGQTEGADGQFTCITKCFAANAEMVLDEAELLGNCATDCNDCPGEINQETNDLIGEANDPATCQAECFPFE